MTRRIVVSIAILCALAAAARPSHAQLPLGHYQPGMYSIDTMMEWPPVSGIFGSMYFIHYGSDRLNGNDGKPLTRTFTTAGRRKVTLDLSYHNFTAYPFLLGMTDVKILGGRFGAAAGVPISGTSLSGALQTVNNQKSINSGTLDIGDANLYPLLLAWPSRNGGTWLAYTVFFPSGRFSPQGTNNSGLGFISNDFQVGSGFYFDKKHTLQLAGLLTYEINTTQQSTGVYVGNHLTFEYGLRKKFTPTFSLGLTGYGQWQTTPTTGTLVTRLNPSARDHVLGLGGELNLILPKANDLTITLRVIHEIDSANRFQGNNINLGISFPLAIYPDAPPPQPTPTPTPTPQETPTVNPGQN